MCCKPVLKQIISNSLQQLLRERQQMASRPFASVDLALEVGAEQADMLRGPLEVGTVCGKGAAVICIFISLLSSASAPAAKGV